MCVYPGVQSWRSELPGIFFFGLGSFFFFFCLVTITALLVCGCKLRLSFKLTC